MFERCVILCFAIRCHCDAILSSVLDCSAGRYHGNRHSHLMLLFCPQHHPCCNDRQIQEKAEEGENKKRWVEERWRSTCLSITSAGCWRWDTFIFILLKQDLQSTGNQSTFTFLSVCVWELQLTFQISQRNRRKNHFHEVLINKSVQEHPAGPWGCSSSGIETDGRLLHF